MSICYADGMPLKGILDYVTKRIISFQMKNIGWRDAHDITCFMRTLNFVVK